MSRKRDAFEFFGPYGIGSQAGLLAILNLFDDTAHQPLPYEIFRALADLFIEKRRNIKNPPYTLVPWGDELKS